jgi:beta-lactamase regulating signal transducer with metallopeptidase domain
MKRRPATRHVHRDHDRAEGSRQDDIAPQNERVGETSMFEWIAETTIVAAGIAVIAMAASRLRSIGPAIRHALWLVVLIKLITPPVIAWPWADRSHGFQAAESGRTRGRREPVSAPASMRSDNGVRRLVAEGWVRPEKAARPLTAMVVPASPWFSSMLEPSTLVRDLGWAWVAVTVLLGAAQASRIVRFQRRLRGAVPAPDALVDEVDRISQRLGTTMPEVLVVPDLGTPLLWCLGRPRLLLPAQLVKTLPLDRWRGVLAHEVAHLHRGDHWVSRLELAVGLVWWWNPIYWLARARLDAEAELACDAWVVWAMPKDRLVYAEVLFDICTRLSLARPPAPTVGVAGSGRFFERRLSMILNDHVPYRLSPSGLLAACLLLVSAVPSWSAISATVARDQMSDVEVSSVAGEDDDGDDAVTRSKKGDADAKAKSSKADRDLDVDVSAIEKEIDARFGPGSDFEKKMEAFGKEMEAKFGDGSDFEKRMEAFGKEMEAKFGDGSDFEKRMEAFGDEIEAKFGPGSDFEKMIKSLVDGITDAIAPGSDDAGKVKVRSRTDVDSKTRKEQAEKPSSSGAHPESADSKGSVQDRRREQRIRELEAQIAKLGQEIKTLKSNDDGDNNPKK